MVKITINGRALEVEDGQTVLAVARQNGIEIPTLCYAKHLTVSGSCRMCMVDITGMKNMQPACNTPVKEGMIVVTDSERILDFRKVNAEFIMAHHPVDCQVCDTCGSCELQDLIYGIGPSARRFSEKKRTMPKQDFSEKLALDMNRCIHCRRCARYARDVVKSKHWATLYRGWHTYFGVYADTVDFDQESDSWGNMIDLCPTGAITAKKGLQGVRLWELTQKKAKSKKCKQGCCATIWIIEPEQELIQVTARKENGDVLGFICDHCRFESKAMSDWVIED